MKAVLMHPYRHHSYNIVKSLSNLDCHINAYYGYYNKKGLIYNNMNKFGNIKLISKFLGYNDEEIDEYVNTSFSSNALFLLSKINKSKTKLFLQRFENDCLKKIDNYDVLIALQDYCQDVIEYANKKNKIIIYDQIMPCGYKQRKLLIKECEKSNFNLDYVDKYLPKEKIDRNYENIKRANIILNASKSTFNITKEVLGEAKVSEKSIIVPYGTNTSSLSEKEFEKYIQKKLSSIYKRKLKILYVGSICLAKGTRILLEIINNLNENEVEFGVVGVANKEDDNFFVEKLKEHSNVKYYGAIPHKQIKTIYEAYDLFVFPSIIEGFGMVTLEAMSLGLPCIVNEYCCSVIDDNYNGIIVREANEYEYIKSIEYIINNKDVLYNMSINAYNTSKIYTWSKYQKELADSIKDFILDK